VKDKYDGLTRQFTGLMSDEKTRQTNLRALLDAKEELTKFGGNDIHGATQESHDAQDAFRAAAAALPDTPQTHEIKERLLWAADQLKNKDGLEDGRRHDEPLTKSGGRAHARDDGRWPRRFEPATPAVSHFAFRASRHRAPWPGEISRNGDRGVADGWRVGREAPLVRDDPLPRRCAVGDDEVTSTRLAAMEREHARLETEWRAIGADLEALDVQAGRTGKDDRAAPVLLPRELRDAIEALPAGGPVAPTHAPPAHSLFRA
jgi:hypothetical protein